MTEITRHTMHRRYINQMERRLGQVITQSHHRFEFDLENVRQLKKFDKVKLKEFNDMSKAIINAAIQLNKHESDFKITILKIFHQYMHTQGWTWKNNMANNEERGYRTLAELLNMIMRGKYFICVKKSHSISYSRRFFNFTINYALFPDKTVCDKSFGRFRKNCFQWSKRGLVEWIVYAVHILENHMSYSDYTRNQIDKKNIRNTLINAETDLLIAKLQYDIFKQMNYMEHPKFKLAIFLGINIDDMLIFMAPNAYHEMKLRAAAIKKWYEKDMLSMMK